MVGLVVVVLAIVWWRSRGDGSERSRTSEAPTSAAKVTGDVAAPRASRIDPRTQKRASIRGTVHDDAKAPIAGVTVCASGWAHGVPSEEMREPRCVPADATGAYVIENLVPARYMVSASARGYLPTVFHPEGDRHRTQFHVAPAETKTGVDLVLRKGGVEITGIVHDISGGVVPQASVQVTGGGWDEDGAQVAPVQTDGQGAFSIWVRPGQLAIEAHADGYAPTRTWGRAPGTFELFLTPESTLSGIVVDAVTGKPVEGARVVNGTWEWDGSQNARTDAEGKFRLVGLTPDRYTVTARTERGYGRSEGSTLVGLGQHVDGVVVKLHAASRITGKVMIAGTPPRVCIDAGASIRDEDNGRWLTTRVEPDGTIIADGVLPGTYTVRPSCQGYQRRDTYDDIVIEAGKDREGLTWEVDAGAVIRGRVLAKSGAPIEGAMVSARSTGGPARAKQDWGGDRSTDDGSYELIGMKAGAYKLDVHTEKGVAPKDGYKLEVAAGATLQQDLVLEDGGTIRGTVRDEKGAPVAGVSVQANKVGEGSFYYWGGDVKSDARGEFTLEGVRPGDYRVIARRGWGDALRKPGTTDDDKQGERVSVKAGGTANVALVVEGQHGVIKGSVVDVAGAPVSDAYVSATRESDAAGASSRMQLARWGEWDDASRPVLAGTDGTFTISKLPPGKYTLRAYRRGGGEAFVEHIPVGGSAKLQIKPTGSLAGTVRVEGGPPPDQITVSVTDLKTGFDRSETFFRTGGVFAVEDLPAGHFTVTATTATGEKKLELDLAEGEAKTGLAITLEPMVTLTGRVVVLGTTTPVPGLRMMASAAQGQSFTFGPSSKGDENITDEAGRFTIKKAPKGRLQIMGIHRDFQDSEYGWLQAYRTVTESGTTDIGDLGILKKRVKQGDPVGELGAKFKEQPPETPPDQSTIEVSFVEPGSAAQRAGIQVGDVIIEIDGISVAGEGAGHAWTLMRAPPGTKLTIVVKRGDEKLTVTATLLAPS